MDKKNPIQYASKIHYQTLLQSRVEGIEPVPTAALTVEDAELMYRLQKRGNI